MRPCVLVVAADIDSRARIARQLHASGFAVEIASDDGRALRLAGERNFLSAVGGSWVDLGRPANDAGAS